MCSASESFPYLTAVPKRFVLSGFLNAAVTSCLGEDPSSTLVEISVTQYRSRRVDLIRHQLWWTAKQLAGVWDLGSGYNFESTSIRFRFDCDSTARHPFDKLRHDRTSARPYLCARAAARCGFKKWHNNSGWLRLAGNVTVNLITFHKQSKVRRTSVEQTSNRSRIVINL